ncbi:MAG: pseudouridine synthase [Acidimicrobiia bacterium]
MPTEKLHKVMARTGIASRRASEILIDRGRVTVDGRPAEVGMRVDAETAHIEVDGVPLPVRPGLVHYLLNKPTGVVSTVADPQGRPTVVDLVPDQPAVHPVGRLDLDSGGLLVLTNDGDLTQLLTHPRHGVTKTYRALVDGRVVDRVARSLVDGVVLEDGPAAAVSARIIDVHGDRSLVEVVMGEGRNREVRRMLDAVGHPVLELFRTAIGPVHDAGLRAGEWRHLALDEVRSLYEVAGR